MITGFNHFLGRFTYHQRYLFLACLFLVSLLFPSYWIVHHENTRLQQIEKQKKGSRISENWFHLLDVTLQSFIEDVSSSGAAKYHLKDAYELLESILADDENLKNQTDTITIQKGFKTFKHIWEESLKKNTDLKNSFDLFIQQLKLHIHNIAFEYSLVLQNEESNQKISQAVFFSFVNQAVTYTHIYSLFTELSKQNKEKEFLQLQLNSKVDLLENYCQNTYKLVSSAYESMQKQNFFGSNSVLTRHLAAIQQLTTSYRSQLQFLERVREGLQDENDHEQSAFPSLEYTLELLAGIKESRNRANQIYFSILLEQQNTLLWQKNVVIMVFVFSFFITFIFIVFGFITGPFSKIERLIEKIGRGENPVFNSFHFDTPIGLFLNGLKVMAQTTKNKLEQAKTLHQELDQFFKESKKALNEQEQSFKIHANRFAIFNTVSALPFEEIKKVAAKMVTFMNQFKREKVIHAASIQLKNIKTEAIYLNETSNKILDNLSLVLASMHKTEKIALFMSKISENISLLSLNATIEALNVGEDKQKFHSITDKIKGFADLASNSSSTIHQIIAQISESVDTGKNTAGNYLKKTAIQTERLLAVTDQLNGIFLQEEFQIENLNSLNTLVQSQSLVMSLMNDLTINLKRDIENNQLAIKQYHSGANECERILIELNDSLESFYSPSERAR